MQTACCGAFLVGITPILCGRCTACGVANVEGQAGAAADRTASEAADHQGPGGLPAAVVQGAVPTEAFNPLKPTPGEQAVLDDLAAFDRAVAAAFDFRPGQGRP